MKEKYKLEIYLAFCLLATWFYLWLIDNLRIVLNYQAESAQFSNNEKTLGFLLVFGLMAYLSKNIYGTKKLEGVLGSYLKMTLVFVPVVSLLLVFWSFLPSALSGNFVFLTAKKEFVGHLIVGLSCTTSHWLVMRGMYKALVTN